MLVGQYQNSLDDKGRLLIPAKFRNEISGNMVYVAPGIDSCLRIFTPEQWNIVVDEIMGSGSTFQKETRDLMRALVSPASECEIDKAGRVRVPQLLQERVGIVKEVLVVGAVEYIEIWSPEQYQAATEVSAEDVLVATEKIGGFYASRRKGETV